LTENNSHFSDMTQWVMDFVVGWIRMANNVSVLNGLVNHVHYPIGIFASQSASFWIPFEIQSIFVPNGRSK